MDTEHPLFSGSILADDMGLRKTLKIIALIVVGLDRPDGSTRRETYPTLIIAPVSVMSSWSGQVGFLLLSTPFWY